MIFAVRKNGADRILDEINRFRRTNGMETLTPMGLKQIQEKAARGVRDAEVEQLEDATNRLREEEKGVNKFRGKKPDSDKNTK
jgi:hypothetical protein